MPPALPSDLTDALLELTTAAQRLAMYPAGHPLVEPAIAAVARRFELAFLERPAAVLGVSPTRLISGAAQSDERQPLLAELAGRFYRRNVGAVRITRGVTRSELHALLGFLREEPSDATLQACPHITFYPPSYDHLALLEPEASEKTAEERFGAEWAGRLWAGLARAVMGDALTDTAALGADPGAIADAIEAGAGDAAFGRRVGTALVEAARGLAGRGESERATLQRYLSRLLSALSPATLQQLLTSAGALAEQHRTLSDLSEALNAEVVVLLVDSAARARGGSLSPALLQMLSKLASHAEAGAPVTRPRAEEALRRLVRDLIARWDTADLAAGADGTGVPAVAPAPDDGIQAYPAEPERVIDLSLALGVCEAATLRAADRIVAAGRTGFLLDRLGSRPADDHAAAGLRRRVYSRSTVLRVLGDAPLDLDLLDRLIPAAGIDAMGPLFDVLAASADRRVRARLLELLSRYGAAAAPEAMLRLEGAPWYVQRNLLKLLSQLPELPADFKAGAILSHPDARVRHEALRLLLRDPANRGSAILHALEAPDDATVRLGLLAASDDCPPAAVGPILELLNAGTLDREAQAHAVRAIAPTRSDHVLAALLQIGRVRGWLGFGRRLAPRSPALLAALDALATHWRYQPEAESLLEQARRQRDPEIRDAAAVRMDSAVESAGPVILMP